jgi:hypothetical protein
MKGAIPLLLAAVFSCAADGADWTGLRAHGFGEIAFETQEGRRLLARTYRSSRFDAQHGPIWVVMHGQSRDVERYIESAAPVAERYAALVVAPHVSKEDYPAGSDYTLDRPLYAEIERLFDAIRGSLGGEQRGYYLFGHSAGAQFTHRLLTFLPSARVLEAVAANAGWYTLPIDDDSPLHQMPYGLHGGPIEPAQLRHFFATPFVVLLGERDTTTAETDRLVRGTPEANAQGKTRLARGRNYYATGKAAAERLHTSFAWRLAVVPRAAHDAARMIDSAGFFLFTPDATPCQASRARDGAALVVTEILADPAPGAAGDANGDGKRDPSEDELVELVNTGSRPVCLAGWALGDVEQPERHVFPLGRALAPGKKLIVFGGGVPTGDFDGAEVQWTTAGLSLSKAGDVITLRDAENSVALQISWGDCAGAPCAKDHWPKELAIHGPLVREARTGASWKPHAEGS